MNTYGLFSINNTTFNIYYNDTITYPREQRNFIVTFLRINNAVLNTLGYVPGVSLFSGCFRIYIGLEITVATFVKGDPKATEGHIIGHWSDEAIATGITQIARGILEAFVPFGWAANIALDVVATLYTITDLKLRSISRGSMGAVERSPHCEPDYPLPLRFLYVV